MRIRHVTLDGAADSGGVVVVIDVLRAFTVASFAFSAGVTAIRCVRTVDEALQLRKAHPGSVAIGEVGGRPVPEFDVGNSPTALSRLDLAGRLLIHRSSAGTQGLVGAAAVASDLFAASFACAGATARAVAALAPKQVTFVSTGVDERDGDEDVACAEYLAALLTGDDVDPEPYLQRVWTSDAAKLFTESDDPDFPVSDVEMAVRLDAVDFALRADVDDGQPTLRTLETAAPA